MSKKSYFLPKNGIRNMGYLNKDHNLYSLNVKYSGVSIDGSFGQKIFLGQSCGL